MKIKKNIDKICIETDVYYQALIKSDEALKRKEYDLALDILDKAIKLNEELNGCIGERADYYVRSAIVCRTKKDCNSELAFLTKAVELRGWDWDLQKRGQVYEEMGDFAAAIADYTKAIEAGGEPHSYELRAMTYFKKADYESAIADFTKAIENCGDVKCKGCVENRAYIEKAKKLNGNFVYLPLTNNQKR